MKEAITLIYQLKAITVRSDNGGQALCDNAKT
jgi:hypothetical protein